MGDATDPELIIHPYDVPSREKFSELIDVEGKDIPTLFVYVPADTTTYGPVQQFLAPYTERFPVIYVYPKTAP